MRDITLEDTFRFPFTTRAFATGVPTVLAGTPVLSVLEENNATPITAGVTVSVDRASVVGLNEGTVIATAANGYETGKSYGVYISTGTVGGVSVVGEVVHEFTIGLSAAFTRLGAPAGASVSADIAEIPTVLANGTAQSGTSSTIRLAAAESFAGSELIGNVVKITGGTGAGQSRWISANVGATDVCTVVPDWTTTPDATSVYEIGPGAASMQAILDSDLTETTTGLLANNFDTFYDNKNANTLKTVDDVGTAPPFPASGWVWSTATAGTPAAGRIRGNNATIASITEVVVHEESDDAKNTNLVLSSLRAGDRVGIYFEANPDIFLIFDITATPTLASSTYTITGTIDSTAGIFTNTRVNVLFETPSLDATADAVWDEILTGATHNISTSSGRRLRGIQDFGQYLGAIHIDTINGTAGTIVDENGTADNPVLTLADAITLNSTLNFNTFLMSPSSSITLAQTFNNFLFSGRDGWTLALGGQDVGGTHFEDANVSGTGTGSTETSFERCNLATCTLNPFHVNNCSLSGTLTFATAGNYLISNTHSRIAGATTPIIDTGAAVANVNLAMPGYDNGVEIRNLNASGADEFSISGIGQIIYAANSSGTVNQRGDWEVTNTGGVIITEDDNTANISAILTDTGTTLPAQITAIFTTQMTEAYAADGVAPTPAQALFMIQQILGDFSISGTVLTVREIDGATTAAKYNLDSATTPTDITRAT